MKPLKFEYSLLAQRGPMRAEETKSKARAVQSASWAIGRLEGWRVAYRVVAQDGVPTIAEVRVFPDEPRSKYEENEWNGDPSLVPAGGITRSILRFLPTGRGAQLIGTLLPKWLVDQDLALFFDKSGPQRFRREALKKVPRNPRRKGHGDLFYAQLARDYVLACKKDPKRPRALLAEKYGFRGEQGNARMRDMLHDARRKDMLTSSGSGIPVGSLTARAVEVLNAHEKGAKR